jgi:tryptophan-rich sensory protein
MPIKVLTQSAFLFVLLCSWVGAAFVPLCTKRRSDRLAAIASVIGLFVLVVLAIILGASSTRFVRVS